MESLTFDSSDVGLVEATVSKLYGTVPSQTLYK